MSSSANARLKTKGFSKKALWQLVFIAGLLALISISFGQNVLSLQRQGSMPQRLGALKLTEQSEGPEAKAAVSRLHGTDINMVTAYIATYARDNEKVTAWVGKAASTAAAAELMGKMVEGIGKGNPEFSNMKRLTITQGYHGHEVYQVDGPGGEHFFYISKLSQDEVVWLSIQAENAGPLLETAINTF